MYAVELMFVAEAVVEVKAVVEVFILSPEIRAATKCSPVLLWLSCSTDKDRHSNAVCVCTRVTSVWPEITYRHRQHLHNTDQRFIKHHHPLHRNHNYIQSSGADV